VQPQARILARRGLEHFDAAVARLKHALDLKPDVAEANAALGVIYYKQGRMAEAEVALRAELAGHPNDLKCQQNLAAVLEAQQRPEEAMPLLQAVLQAKPDSADARYLVGKILLAQGDAEGATPQLEAAARLSPEDAYVHYQLARAYQRLGRTELAQKELEVYRRIKDTLPEGEEIVTPLGSARLAREGRDLSIVTYGATVWKSLEAAERLEREDGVSVEVLDLRTLLPLDDDAILATVKKTNKLLIVHEDTRTGGLAGEITARVSERAFEWLDGPVMRVTAHDVPLPYAPTLEDFVLPQTDDIVKAARWLANY